MGTERETKTGADQSGSGGEYTNGGWHEGEGRFGDGFGLGDVGGRGDGITVHQHTRMQTTKMKTNPPYESASRYPGLCRRVNVGPTSWCCRGLCRRVDISRFRRVGKLIRPGLCAAAPKGESKGSSYRALRLTVNSVELLYSTACRP